MGSPWFGMPWGADSTALVAGARGARVTYLEAKADGGNDTEDGGPGGGPVACVEEAQSKEHKAFMERKTSCQTVQPGCHHGNLLPSDSGIKGYCWGESWGWELPATVSCPQFTPTTHSIQHHPCPASSPAPCHCSCHCSGQEGHGADPPTWRAGGAQSNAGSLPAGSISG